MKRVRVRRDKYHGRVLSLDGCDHPVKRLRAMYDGTRRKHFDRRISLAVALHVVAGSDRARQYLVKRDWSPSVTHRRA